MRGAPRELAPVPPCPEAGPRQLASCRSELPSPRAPFRESFALQLLSSSIWTVLSICRFLSHRTSWQLACSVKGMLDLRWRSVSYAVVLALLNMTAVVAAETRTQRVSWSEVASATTGAKITMVLPGGAEIRGKVLDAEPQALIVNVTKTSSPDVPKGRVSIPRASVATIHSRKCGAKWRAILGIGLPAALMGAAGAAINAQSPPVKGQEAAGLIFGLGAGGAVGGYFIGKQLDCHVTEFIVIPESRTR
jgi:hypothetical protein